MGDVLSLIEKVERKSIRRKRRASREGREGQVHARGPALAAPAGEENGSAVVAGEHAPGAGKISEDDIDEKAIVRMQAILDSMTIKEREFPQIINGHRKKRIAKGLGHLGAGDQSSAEAVPADEEDDEDVLEGLRGAEVREDDEGASSGIHAVSATLAEEVASHDLPRRALAAHPRFRRRGLSGQQRHAHAAAVLAHCRLRASR
jgi:hypothetical protein